jgi:hypothetical protein
MKKLIFSIALLLGLQCTLLAQDKKVVFSKDEQMQIQKVLGKDFTAVLGDKGQLAIVSPKSVADIKSTAKGGFSKLPANAANAVFAAYEKGWVYRQSSLEILKSKLGEERLTQLEGIMKAKGLNMR